MGIKKDAFQNWINQQYRDWTAPEGQRKSVRLWADELGVRRDALSHWMHGIRRPDRQSASLLAKALGPEVYELLGVAKPDPLLQTIIQHWSNLDARGLQEIEATLRRWGSRQN